MARNKGSEAVRTTASPALVATVHTAWPAETPKAVATPVRRSPSRVFRIVSAVSCPGVQMTRRETPRNARYGPCPTAASISATRPYGPPPPGVEDDGQEFAADQPRVVARPGRLGS